MRGHRPFRPHGGYPPSQPSFGPQNPNFPLQHPNVLQFLQTQPNFALQQNPNNFFFQNPFPYSLPQNPNITTQQPPQQLFNNPRSSQSQLHNQRGSATSGQVPREVQERINQAVNQAWQGLMASRNSVTAWKVSQAALVELQADSWSSLGLDMQGVPSLQKLMTIEGRVNAFIQCFVGVRKITTLYELEMEICKNEGVRTYEKLELGPFLCHPLVLHYFSLNSNCKKVFKITSEDVIAHLHEYMDSHNNQEILIDEFLGFVADKQAATSKEELGVRIQSLAMYTSFIKMAERRKDFEVKKCPKGPKVKKHCKGLKLKERYMSISQQVESFMSVHKDSCGKHIRFDSSSSEEEDANDRAHKNERNSNGEGSDSELPSEVINSSDRVSRCPYPSATEELIRLGLKERINKPSPTTVSSKHNDCTGPYKRKRKIDSPSPSVSRPPKLSRRDGLKQAAIPKENGNQAEELSNLDEADILLSDNLMKTFITTWKEACREHTMEEVLQRMLCFYHSTARKRNKMKSMLSSFPFIGLLNVAVTSIKKGMWDSIYDTIQAVGKFELTGTSDTCSEHKSIDVEPSKEGALVPTSVDCVTVEDVLEKINAYFKLNHEIGKSLKEQKIVLLRKLFNCQSWLAEQFYVKNFKSLGLGEFFMFLERHASLFPIELQKLLADETCEKSPLEVCFLQHLLIVFMAQASYNLQDNQIISKEVVKALLMKQYPLIDFKVKENDSMEYFLEVVEKSKNDASSKCVIFSASLLGMCHNGDSLAYGENYSSETSFQNVRKIKSAACRDAMAVLLRAPMLSDLYSWSHWDVLFAPSLGSLIVWLLNEVNEKELLCLVTKDGKVVRINHSATIDSFLEAALKGSAFETALMLLSLCSLTGGIKHLPLALLKHHAQMAFEVLLKNHIENIEVDGYQNSTMNGKTSFRPKFLEDVSIGNLGNGLQMNSIKMNKATSHVSRFFLDCLCYLPSEFRGCAADILLHGMRAVIKDWPSAISSECNDLSQRFMLHELGFSLGIVEWIQDYHVFCSTDTSNRFPSYEVLEMTTGMSDSKTRSKSLQNAIDKRSYAEKESIASNRTDKEPEVSDMVSGEEVSAEKRANKNREQSSEVDEQTDAALIIESIRRDEFGLDPSLSGVESSMLKKQHARLGRALHCLSQELYSQDSHFILELVQNADDNVYSESEEPTLTFILQESGIFVLNNELGFSAENVRALCDVGSSTKKGRSGYIGKKGIGFKSVFRVTDAPEIHSNGFHVKFDISDGQIGFVLPTLVPPCNVESFKMLFGGDTSYLDNKYWNTCIILPFRSVTSEGNDRNNIVSMFSDLHPSLLLFLHRIRCIMFRNMLNNSFVVMRKEIVGNGIVKVSCGGENMTWFVASQNLQADIIHRDVQVTEISIALTLQETDCGCYRPFLDPQPVFAFLPLRTYGLKFILQGDFVLPSSREEVDVDSPWNQWLLSQYPSLFVSVVRLFCSLPCFQENPGKAVSVYMSFVPLVGEVHGFFSSLPRMIISMLRMSNCLILEGDKSKWVPSCKVLRGWTESARKLFPDPLLHEHLGLGYLDKDIILSDALARALGIQDYGPEVLVQIISSLCQRENDLKHMGLTWISSWLNEFYTISFHSSGQKSMNCEIETVLVENLRKIPFIPLSDGTFSSVDEGTIWLHSDAINTGFEGELGLETFPTLYAKLRFVSPALFSKSAVSISSVGNITSVLHNIGVQQLSAHEIIKVHILPDIYDERIKTRDKNLMIDYLCFVMIHLRSSCPSCHVEREHIILDLRNKAFILTNYGFKRPVDVSVHFSKEFENPVNINRLTNGMNLKWHEVDKTYLKHPASRLLSSGLKKWREFFLEIGVTDFVQVVQHDKSFMDMAHTVLQSLSSDWDLISPGSVVKDWESYELIQLLSLLSTSGNLEGCKYMLEILDEFWDGHFSDKAIVHCNFKSGSEIKPFRSSFLCKICDIPWVVSCMDNELHHPKELFHDCDPVRAILGACAPYAVPKVRNGKLVKDIGLKTEVTLDDVLKILKFWRSEISFKASIAQMSRLYTFIWNEARNSRQKIYEEFHASSFIFVPNSTTSRPDDVVPGLFLSSKEVFWHDSTGTMEQMYNHSQTGSSVENQCPLNRTLSNIYPGLRDFLVSECKVPEQPSFCGYLDILLQLSALTLPSQAANTVFQVFLKWADALRSGLLSTEDIHQMKECLNKSEYTVLPTILDKWVSLHPSFGLVCWCDNEKLKKRFKHLDNIDFLYFGTLNDGEKELLQTKVSILIRTFGIPVLSEVVTREAIFDGKADGRFGTSLVNWVLPFAQRYLYSVHPDKYFQLKQSGFDNISNLQVVVVDKLYYRNVIRSSGIVSKKKYECTCLLQENILYTTPESDSHAVYMEFSRFLFDGTPDLHLANFLHMVTTMAKSGSNEEQTEFFILNSQKVRKLPDEEPVWSLSSVSYGTENNEFESSTTTVENEQSASKSKKKKGTYSNWPPVDWKTVPGLSKRPAPISQPIDGSKTTYNGSDHIDLHISSDGPVATDTDISREDNTETTSSIPIFPDSESLDGQYGNTFNPADSGVRIAFGNTCNPIDSGVRIAFDPVDLSLMSDSPQLVSLDFNKRIQHNAGFVSSEFSQRDQLLTGTPSSAQALLTGKLGELAAFNYFASTSGKTVKWVNKDIETGLPYDLVVEDGGGHIEYVEVKATKSARKDWFNISTREWQFAAEQGESFSIAHVFLLSDKEAKISVHTNPIKLCQQGKLQLVVLMPRQRQDSIIVS
ncbi:protein NO VEIN-like [Hibiscus syriacus]|nr:protein NO VEIN-like [Hibiscus syriacus]